MLDIMSFYTLFCSHPPSKPRIGFLEPPEHHSDCDSSIVSRNNSNIWRWRFGSTFTVIGESRGVGRSHRFESQSKVVFGESVKRVVFPGKTYNEVYRAIQQAFSLKPREPLDLKIDDGVDEIAVDGDEDLLQLSVTDKIVVTLVKPVEASPGLKQVSSRACAAM
jgi:hypothetical protein